MVDFWKFIPHATLLSGIFAMGLGALISLIAIPVVVRICKVKGLTDKANGRSSHVGAIPSLGGVAIFSGVFLGVGLLMPPVVWAGSLRYILSATFILFLIGQKDDIIGISWSKKLLAEILAALIIIELGNLRFTSLQGFAGFYELPLWLSIVISIIVFVGIINAFNLIDGIDGLASGTGILVSFILGCWMFAINEHGMAIMAWSLTGSLLPFFYFNVFGKENKLFMGDTGSLIVGILMAVFAAVICSAELPADHDFYMKAAPAVVMGVLIYPIYDLVRVVVLRLVKGKSPFVADQNNVHHLFLAAGYSHRRSTFYILLLNVMAIAWAFAFRNSSILFLGSSLFAAAIIATLIIIQIGKWRRRMGLPGTQKKEE